MASAKHPNREVEAAIRHAEVNGWTVEIGPAHAWSKRYGPYNDEDCRCGHSCITSICSTPKRPGNFSRRLRRVVDNCTSPRKKLEAAAAGDRDSDAVAAGKQTMDYEFTLNFKLAPEGANLDELVERLGRRVPGSVVLTCVRA